MACSSTHRRSVAPSLAFFALAVLFAIALALWSLVGRDQVDHQLVPNPASSCLRRAAPGGSSRGVGARFEISRGWWSRLGMRRTAGAARRAKSVVAAGAGEGTALDRDRLRQHGLRLPAVWLLCGVQVEAHDLRFCRESTACRPVGRVIDDAMGSRPAVGVCLLVALLLQSPSPT